MVGDFIAGYFSEIKEALDRIDTAAVERAVECLLGAYHNGNQIFVMGNGGSASAASHFACDINKGACRPYIKKFRVISLSDNIPLITAYANDLSYEDVFVEQMPRMMRCRYLPQEDLFAGRWAGAIDALIASPPPPESPRVDGADVAADAIVRLVRS